MAIIALKLHSGNYLQIMETFRFEFIINQNRSFDQTLMFNKTVLNQIDTYIVETFNLHTETANYSLQTKICDIDNEAHPNNENFRNSSKALCDVGH